MVFAIARAHMAHSDRSTAKIHTTFSPPGSCLASQLRFSLFVHFQGPRCDDAFTCSMKPSQKKLDQLSWLISADCFSVFSEINCETICKKSATNTATSRFA